MTSVADLRDRAERDLATVLDGARTVALVNFPNHGNPGDPAIWLGTRTLLGRLGVRVGYVSAPWSLDGDLLRRAVGDAPVLINGGGNVGDLYPRQQGARTTVLRELRSNPVIQMPQSVHFRDPANEAEFVADLEAHGGVTFLARERRTEAIVRGWGVPTVLTPDHGFALGPQAPRLRPEVPILWLARRPGDPEHVDHGEPEGPDVRRVEWLEGVPEHEAGWDATGRLALAVNRWAQRTWVSGGRGNGLRHRAAAATYLPLARRWVQRGFDILATSEVVVTDKLHGHVFSALLGKPHVVLDNSYGKVSGTLDAWSEHLPGVHRAEDGEQALALARELVARGAR